MENISPLIMKEARIEAVPAVEESRESVSKVFNVVGGGVGACLGGAFGLFARSLIRKEEDEQTI